MRITFVLPSAGLSGGIRVPAILAQRLSERGHEVCVLTARPPTPSLAHRLLRWAKRDRKPGSDGLSHLNGCKAKWRVVDQSRPLVDDDLDECDVLVAGWWQCLEWIAPSRKGVKVHFIQGDDRLALPGDDRFAARVEGGWRLPCAKIVVSRWVKDRVLGVAPESRITVVPNAVCTVAFNAPRRHKTSHLTLGFVYSSAHCKGMDVLFRSLDIVRKAFPDCRVLAFGADSPARSLPLPPYVEYHLRPEQTIIPTLYSACDAWLFPSRAEGFGLPILEAMACRTPVIGTDAGAGSELLSGGAGILIRAEDPQDMADAIARVKKMSADEWRAMSDIGYAKVRQYTWDDAAVLFEQSLVTAVQRDSVSGGV